MTGSATGIQWVESMDAQRTPQQRAIQFKLSMHCSEETLNQWHDPEQVIDLMEAQVSLSA